MEYRVDRQGHKALISIRGDWTEQDDFQSLLAQLGDEVVLDLHDVGLINSSGVRAWVRFMRSVPEHARVFLDRCPVQVVHQLNMVRDFGGRAEVRSVFVPFACATCPASFAEALVAVHHLRDGEVEAPRCTACGQPMELDVPVDEYLAFANPD